MSPDDVYCAVGRVVVVFQVLENQLMQLSWMLADPPYSEADRRALASFRFGQLLDETRRRVCHAVGDDDPGESFVRDFDALVARCRTAATKRNTVVHSAYVHLEAGGELVGVLRSDMQKDPAGPGVAFDQEALRPDSFQTITEHMARVAFELGQTRVRLIHAASRRA